MYTLKIESVNNEFLHAVQALVQENRLWSLEVEASIYSTTVTLSTMSIRELKHLVDILESEQFIKEDFNEYLSRKFDY
jgi:hypothetical protein